MEIIKNCDLSELNTFGVKAISRFFVEIKSEQDLKDLIRNPEFIQNQKLFLGMGSNILFTKDFDGIVVLNRIKGIEILKENSDFVFVEAMGGEKWSNLVDFIILRGYWGIENLTLIPSSVGASPVQNIGAYGSEVKDIIEEVEAIEIETGNKKVFQNTECKFGYRDSIFKNELKGRYFILSVTFKFNKKQNLNISYRALKEYSGQNKIQLKTVKEISDVVAEIRKSKLPDPKILGNAGSFFKNIYVDFGKIQEIKKEYPELPFFEENKTFKISSGWLIEKCGWKGKRIGNVGVNEKQSLILVNYGGATGEEILELANQIIADVFSKFGLKLTPEVNLI